MAYDHLKIEKMHETFVLKKSEKGNKNVVLTEKYLLSSFATKDDFYTAIKRFTGLKQEAVLNNDGSIRVIPENMVKAEYAIDISLKQVNIVDVNKGDDDSKYEKEKEKNIKKNSDPFSTIDLSASVYGGNDFVTQLYDNVVIQIYAEMHVNQNINIINVSIGPIRSSKVKIKAAATTNDHVKSYQVLLTFIKDLLKFNVKDDGIHETDKQENGML